MLKDISSGKPHDHFVFREAMQGDRDAPATRIALAYLELYTKRQCAGQFEIFTRAAWRCCFDAGVKICEAIAADTDYSLAARCEAKLSALNLQFHPYINAHADMSTTVKLISETATDYTAMLHQLELISLCAYDINLWRKIKPSALIATKRILSTLKMKSEHSVKTKGSHRKLLAELEAELNHRIAGAYAPALGDSIPRNPTLTTDW